MKKLKRELAALGDAKQIAGATAALVIDPANSPRIFAGAADGLYMCRDGGKTWTKVNGASGGQVRTALDCAIDPSNPDMVYAATLDSALLKSTDGGKSWKEMGVADEKTITSVAVSPLDSNIIYAGTATGMYKTKDAGVSWNKVFSEPKAIESIAIDGVNPEVIYLGAADGLYKSADGGASWKQAATDSIGAGAVREVAVAPADSKAVYAATDGGVYGSSDAGAHWQELSKGTGIKGASAIAFDPVNSGTVWAASASGLYKTAMGGAAAPAVPAVAPGEAGAAVTEPVAEKVESPKVEESSAEAKKIEEAVPEKTVPGEEKVESVTIAEGVQVPDMGAKAAAPAGPAIPTIDDVQTVLGQFSHEPTVQEIQEVAMRFAEVHPDIIEGWRKGAKYRALLPRFVLETDFNLRVRANDESNQKLRTLDEEKTKMYDKTEITPGTGIDYTNYLQDETRYLTEYTTSYQTGDDRQRERRLGFKFDWDLGDFLFNPDQIRISDESRDLVELRNDVLEEVTQFYFQRRNLQIDILLSPAEDLRERIRLELQLQEVTANIDYLTGGYLTQRMNDVKQGKVRKSNPLKRLFSI
ncbi:MAG: YCF48-related protein [Candidatus Aureabacteria bacterium]|nr:YCF48-related protein [Candidatus Auribacterota bacterium]